MVRKLIAGNWKMNGLSTALSEVQMIGEQLENLPDRADCLICPPATLLSRISDRAGPRLKLGGQTCHAKALGAHTGDLSALMLADAGASYVIVGHSERRGDHGETSPIVAKQAEAAQDAGLVPIICVGESLAERKAGTTLAVIGDQLAQSIPDNLHSEKGFVVAYEPIWAIGTGQVPTRVQIREVHQHIRGMLSHRFSETGASLPVLYGGSVNPENAESIFNIEDVNGGLIGGASLKANDFMAIYRTAIALD